MQYNRRHLTFNSKKLFIRFVNFFQKNRNLIRIIKNRLKIMLSVILPDSDTKVHRIWKHKP